MNDEKNDKPDDAAKPEGTPTSETPVTPEVTSVSKTEEPAKPAATIPVLVAAPAEEVAAEVSPLLKP